MLGSQTLPCAILAREGKRDLATGDLIGYIGDMAKRPTNIAGMAQSNREIPVSVVARDARTGRFVVVKGASSMASQVLQIKKGVDLTKPIARQVLGKSKPKRVAKG